MAKSKNHTAHNQTFKAHKHRIVRPKVSKDIVLKYVDCKFKKNLLHSRKNNKIAKKN